VEGKRFVTGVTSLDTLQGNVQIRMREIVEDEGGEGMETLSATNVTGLDTLHGNVPAVMEATPAVEVFAIAVTEPDTLPVSVRRMTVDTLVAEEDLCAIAVIGWDTLPGSVRMVMEGEVEDMVAAVSLEVPVDPSVTSVTDLDILRESVARRRIAVISVTARVTLPGTAVRKKMFATTATRLDTW